MEEVEFVPSVLTKPPQSKSKDPCVLTNGLPVAQRPVLYGRITSAAIFAKGGRRPTNHSQRLQKFVVNPVTGIERALT